jgi:hypothetical protein
MNLRSYISQVLSMKGPFVGGKGKTHALCYGVFSAHEYETPYINRLELLV